MRSHALFTRAACLSAMAVLFVGGAAQAQTGSGFSDYFVLGHEEHVWNMMDRVRAGEGAGAFVGGVNRMNSIVSATSTASGQLVYYDQWEDGFETANLTTGPPFAPVLSATTLVLGDGNNANGRVCDWSTDPRVFPCNGTAGHDDVLYPGTPLSFASDQGMNAGGAALTFNFNCNVPVASPATTQLRCSVPVPRAVPALATPTIRFDGGDRVFSAGGSLSIAHIQDPGTPLIGGGTELIARELVKDAVAYSIPIGENLFPGANNAYLSVKYGSLDLVAFEDNTSVSVNSPGFGTVSFVLHRGQHYSTCATFAAGSPGVCSAGAIDGPLGPLPDNRGVFAPLALTLNSGTKISTSAPLNALIFTGGQGQYQTRHYATLPDILHATDYVITAPGDDTAVEGTRSLNLYIYNPNPTIAINVTATDSVGTTVIPIAANSVVDYRNATGRFVPNDSGVRLTSTRPFWGLSAYGITDNISDWGHSWLGVRFLSAEYTLAYSPGSQPAGSGTNTVWSANLASLTRNGAGVATGTTSSPHGFTAGEQVLVTGVTNVTAFNGNFVVVATPTTTTFTYALVGAAVTATGPSLKAVTNGCDPVATAALPCNSFNRDPAWVAGTQNGTQVKVDFNNDNLWDFIDTDSDNCPNDGDVVVAAGICEAPPVIAGCGAVTANKCVYLVNSPGAGGRDVLRIFDYTDFDNAGTHVLATQPVAMSWGQDVDQGQASDPSPDSGYTIYPEISVDLVMGLQKSVTPARVPLGGTNAQRTATYTVRVFAGDYGPLTFLSVQDLLPTGIDCVDYVAGSTLITYPDLSQTTVDPVCTNNVAPARDVLTWTPTPATLLANQQILITYRIVIPVSLVGRTLVNEATVVGNLGSSVFRPKDSATLNQSDLTNVKSVTDDGTPEVGDILTYTVTVTNGGIAETNVVLTDAIPAFTTFVPGSITTTNTIVNPVVSITRVGTLATATVTAHGWSNGQTVTISGATDPLYNGSFVISAVAANTFQYTMTGTPAVSPAGGTILARRATFDAGQNAVLWSGSTFAANAVATLTFQVRITESTPTGSIISNGANYSSTLMPSMVSNTVDRTVVGPTVQITKSGPPSPLHPNQLADFELLIANVGTGPARTLSVTDNLASSNTTYVPGTMSWSLNSGPFIPLTDGIDADQASVSGTTLTFTFARNVTTITRVGALATVTTTLPHGWILGQTVTIAGASDPLYDGNFVITGPVTATMFTYTMAGTPAASPAVGALTAAVTTLPQGSNIRFRFQTRVNLNTGGLFAANQAQVTATGQPNTDSNLVQIPIVGNATVTGHVFLDSNGDGVQNPGEPDLPNVTVTITDSTAVVQTVVTDALGNYSVVVPAGNTSLNPDQTDPDIPSGSTLSTGNDPQTVLAVANNTIASGAVGYAPPPISIAKTSNAGGTVVPGQTVTYTVTVSNFTGATQTGVTLNDPVPTGTTFVPASASVTYTTTTPAIRVTEYFLDNAGTDGLANDLCTEAGVDFSGTVCTLKLNQNLATNYFVIVQGSEDGGADRQPRSDYAALTGDPFGGTDLPTTTAADRIQLTRNFDVVNWSGVVTVVECISGNCATDPNGFRLVDIKRINHAAAAGVVTATVALNGVKAWTDLTRAMLVGGANGAGCDTSSNDVDEHHACHPRLTPVSSTTFDWSRDAGGSATLDTANTTVMAIQWGSAWTVQRRAILAGNNGGDAINAVGEYNTVAINSVARARTWVWGTGTTGNADNGTGDSPEGVALTLGDGVATNATESSIAAGIDVAGSDINFDVYALTHPLLAVDHQFLTEGNNGSVSVNQAVTSATANRMALVYNDFDEHNDDYPKPIFWGRYTTNTNIAIERRRSGGGNWAAWVQGINFNGVLERRTVTCGVTYPPTAGNCTNPDVTGTNPNVATTASAFTIPTGQTLVFTYQVVVNSPLAGGITQVVNTATTTTVENPTARNGSATDNVVRPGVKVEPNNAGFAAVPVTAAGTQILFSQGVTNRGTTADSFNVTLRSDLAGWPLELIDPATGTVIATDSNGDGIWDGGVTVSTGSLAVNATKAYTVRATVPLGTAAGTQNSVELTATSVLSASGTMVKDVGTDEITVLPAATFGPVVLLPDHSGIVTAGQTIAYTHRIFNNTGAAETFDLAANATIGWPTTIYADTNGDGVYTAGVDVAIVNTANLPNGGSQILFVVTMAPVGTPAGTDEVVHLTARSRTNPAQVDAVTDTTTILAATTHDLAGGGTRMGSVNSTTVFPGTLYNLTNSADRYDFSLTPSSLFGIDGLNHPTVLRVDTNGDGIPDTVVATDLEGDGVWNSITVGFNTNANGLPDLAVPANGALAYELVRFIDPNETIWKEYATLTATSFSTGEKDSITAQWIISALSRASIRGLRVDPAGVVEFVTGTQKNTKSFNVYVTSERSREGEKTLLHSAPVLSPMPDSLMPILYRVETAPVIGRYILIEETETTGNVLIYGPYSIINTRMRRGLESVEAQMDRFGVPTGAVRLSKQRFDPEDSDQVLSRALSIRARKAEARNLRNATLAGAQALAAPAGALRIEVAGRGETVISVSTLLSQGMPDYPARKLRLTSYGRRVPVSRVLRAGVDSLIFTAEPLATDYTDENVYILSWGPTTIPTPTVHLTSSADPARPGYTRIERDSYYNASFIGDRWLWDILTGEGETWPYPAWDPTAGQFDLPQLAASGPASVAVKIKLLGGADYRHVISARLNGVDVGSLVFNGRTEGLLEGSVPFGALRAAANELTMVYSAEHDNGSPASAGYVYLDYMDIGAPMVPPPSQAVVTDIRAYDPKMPALGGARYLIVTHPLFRDQADRLAALKTAEGLKAVVVDTESAYDRFSGGVEEPQAIAAVIRRAATASARLKYVVLFGDDNLDPRNHLGGGGTAFIPSIMGRDTYSLIPNENAFADVNDDGRPDLALGRLPVSSVEEATAVVDKIEGQTATLAASGNVHVFVSDDARETDSQFGEDAREMSTLLPPTVTSLLADVGAGIGQARATLFGSWQQGVTMTHYFGHGGPEIWTDEALFSSDDVPSLLNRMPPMVLLAWACQSQYFQYYYAPSVNEALFLLPGSGSLASFGPVGITSPARQRAVFETVYRTLYQDGLSLGEIIRRAKLAALDANPANRDVVDSFMFIGDPSLRIPRP